MDGRRVYDRLMVVGGGLLIAFGVDDPLGMMLVSAGADTIIQKATTGHVDWVQAASAGVMGAIPRRRWSRREARGEGLDTAIAGAGGEATSGAYGYVRQPARTSSPASSPPPPPAPAPAEQPATGHTRSAASFSAEPVRRP